MNKPIIAKCMSCGEPNPKVVETIEYYTAPFGSPVAYRQWHTECSFCGYELDVSDPNEFPSAIKKAESNSVPKMLDELLNANKYSYAEIERSLELPNRLVSNWKKKAKVVRGSLALLRVIRAFPWIIDVAKRHYDTKIVESINRCVLSNSSIGNIAGVRIQYFDSGILDQGLQIPPEFFPANSAMNKSSITNLSLQSVAA